MLAPAANGRLDVRRRPKPAIDPFRKAIALSLLPVDKSIGTPWYSVRPPVKALLLLFAEGEGRQVWLGALTLIESHPQLIGSV